jgi:hypothetical protein
MLATWSGKHDYRREEPGGSSVEKGARFKMTDASVSLQGKSAGMNRRGLLRSTFLPFSARADEPR